MMRFKLKSKVGNHTETDPKTGNLVIYTPGDVVESESDLVARFPDKFERVTVGNEKAAVVQSTETPEAEKTPVQKAAEEGAKDIQPEEPAEELKEEPKEESKKKVLKKKNPLGKDVTEKFPSAEEQELKVFYKKGKGYSITEAGDTSIALNEKPLKKSQIAKFVEEYLEG